MIRAIFLSILTIALPMAALAQDTALRQLDTADESRGWEAVGRLDIDKRGFCTGALIAPNLVLTAAHCLFEKDTGERVDTSKIEFLAGWRNGRASAYRWIRRAVVHPDYVYSGAVEAERVRNDIALLELRHPINNTTVIPFGTNQRPRKGDRIGVVSYAKDRAEAPALQELCRVLARQQGVLVMSCDIDLGSSGSPIFSFEYGEPTIVSVVSAMAEVNGKRVALGAQLEAPLELLKAELAASDGMFQQAPSGSRLDQRRDTGAKFVKPKGG